MTFNANASRYFGEGNKFRKYLDLQDTEILCIQELSEVHFFTQIKSKAGERFYFAFPEKSKRIAIASIYPILKYESLNFLNSSNGAIFADILIKEDTIRVYNMHLKSNEITNIADEMAKNKDIRKAETWQKVKAMFQGYRQNIKIRAEQAEEIATHIEESPYPVIVCGDFNDIPQSYIYQRLAKGKIDHFQTAGRGIGSTFAGKIPFLRIDYILSSKELKPLKSNIIRDRYSDHFPVVSYISIN